MEEQLQILIEAIKDYGAAVISTLSVGGIAAVAGVIAKIKSSIDATKESMNAVLAKKDQETEAMTCRYNSLLNEVQEQNQKISRLTEEITKIKE